MFVLNTLKISECEQFTMQIKDMSALQLMEDAAVAFTEEFVLMVKDIEVEEVVICCGHGNNGGDGLAIARLLTTKKFKVKVVLCDNGQFKRSPLFEKNLGRLLAMNEKTLSIVNEIDDYTLSVSLGRVVLIDAVLGIGLNKPVSGHYAKVIELINKSKLPVIAVDMPSGLFADQITPPNAQIVQAFSTFTMQFMKMSLMLPETYRYCGNVRVLDIGMHMPSHFDTNKLDELSSLIDLHNLLRQPSKFDHKGDNGHGLLVAGSAAMPGAAFLAAKAALRSGIGKITVHIPKSVASLVPVAIPEAVVQKDKNKAIFTRVNLSKLTNINAIAIGCGLGTDPKSVKGFYTFLKAIHKPIVMDADALNMLAKNKMWLNIIPEGSILTPHIKEFERLTCEAHNDFDRIKLLRAFAERYRVVVILKGANSAIATPEGKIYFNISGNPGMATAGSGDVLTGILLALLAKGYNPIHAALLGVFLHGLAGDCAVKKEMSYESLIASDLIASIGKAYHMLYLPEKIGNL